MVQQAFIWILAQLLNLINLILSFLPNVPDFPQDFEDTLNNFFDLIFNYGSNLVCLFIRPTTFQIAVPILIIVINFEYIYKLFMWVVRKIPFFSIK